MPDTLPPGVLSKPEALEKYRKPERTFQRRLSKALRLRDDTFLVHFYLVTSDGIVRKGTEVAEGEVERLKGEGLYPVWHVEEEWFKNEYNRKSQTRTNDKPPQDPTAPQPTDADRSSLDRTALVAEVESLRRALDSEKSHKELLTNQLQIKDDQIRAANEREQQTNVLMKDLHALMGNLQERLPLPAGNASPSTESRVGAKVQDADVIRQDVAEKGSRRKKPATGKKPKATSKERKPKQSGAPRKNTSTVFPTFQSWFDALRR